MKSVRLLCRRTNDPFPHFSVSRRDDLKWVTDEIGVENLPLHRDPKQILAREMAVLGLPATIILNPEGQEIARLRGDADWASDSAKAIIRALIGSNG